LQAQIAKSRHDVEELIREKLDKIWHDTEELLQRELNVIWNQVDTESAKVKELEERLDQSEKKIVNLENLTAQLISTVRANLVLSFLLTNVFTLLNGVSQG
jgi:FKBP-type peptidyl-prolyl cis-trans isomerase (trigger factor)